MKRDRYLKIVLTATAVALWVLALRPVLTPAPSEAASAEKVVRAQRFEVVDEQGRVRAVFGNLPFSTDVTLPMREMPRGVEPGVALFDEDGNPQAYLAVWSDGTPHFSLFDPSRDALWARGLDMSVDTHGTGRLVVSGEDFQSSIVLSMNGENSPGITLRHAKPRVKAYLYARPEGSGLIMSAKDWKRAVNLASWGEGLAGPRLTLHDKAGTPRARLALGTNGTPNLTLHDGEGEDVWSAPAP